MTPHSIGPNPCVAVSLSLRDSQISVAEGSEKRVCGDGRVYLQGIVCVGGDETKKIDINHDTEVAKHEV